MLTPLLEGVSRALTKDKLPEQAKQTQRVSNMAFSFDEIFTYGGQLIVAAKSGSKALIGNSKINHSTYIQGNTQIGKPDAFSSATATLMVGREDTGGTPMSVNVKGCQQIDGDSGMANGLLVSGGSSVNSLYVVGDLFVSGSIDGGNKGRLASRFASADSKPKPFDIKHPSKEGWRLRYACIEGPEVGVYHRGRVRGEKIIKYQTWKILVMLRASQFNYNQLVHIKILL